MEPTMTVISAAFLFGKGAAKDAAITEIEKALEFEVRCFDKYRISKNGVVKCIVEPAKYEFDRLWSEMCHSL